MVFAGRYFQSGFYTSVAGGKTVLHVAWLMIYRTLMAANNKTFQWVWRCSDSSSVRPASSLIRVRILFIFFAETCLIGTP